MLLTWPNCLSSSKVGLEPKSFSFSGALSWGSVPAVVAPTVGVGLLPFLVESIPSVTLPLSLRWSWLSDTVWWSSNFSVIVFCSALRGSEKLRVSLPSRTAGRLNVSVVSGLSFGAIPPWWSSFVAGSPCPTKGEVPLCNVCDSPVWSSVVSLVVFATCTSFEPTASSSPCWDELFAAKSWRCSVFGDLLRSSVGVSGPWSAFSWPGEVDGMHSVRCSLSVSPAFSSAGFIFVTPGPFELATSLWLRWPAFEDPAPPFCVSTCRAVPGL